MVALLTVLGGCRDDAPQPKRVADVEPVVEPRVRPERDGPFADPQTIPPPPRSGAQLDEAALGATLAKGQKLSAAGHTAVAIQTLRKCANRNPISIRCEGELSLLLFGVGNHTAHARYFLTQAATAAPATAPSDLYRRLGDTAIAKARFDAARAAYGVLLARKEATADDLAHYAHALQADPNTTDEAIDVYARAYALDDTRHEFLVKRGTLLAQTGDDARAIDVFEQYMKVAALEGKARDALQRRIDGLRARATASAQKPPQ